MTLLLSNAITHIIRKQRISISFENPSKALGLQNRIAELFYEKLQPQMEALFDEMADEAHTINIDTLEIDCGIIRGKYWEDEWVDSVLFRLKQELNALPKNKTQASQNNNQFFFFLEAGHLSWNHFTKTVTQLEEAIVPDHLFFERLEEILRNSLPARKRLVNQFSEKFLKRLLDDYLKDQQGLIEPDHTNEYSVVSSNRDVKNSIVEFFVGNNQSRGFVKKETNDRVENGIGKKQIRTTQSKEIYIINAGLVLLHPFLPVLFEELQLIRGKQWINKEAQEKALLIAEFLVKGQEEYPEFHLPLNKIICGIGLENALELSLSIKAETKYACEELLTEVIRHWSVLKNTGIESLRETFLQRNGKLTRVDKGWLLQVEQKAVDVLLGKLPWGIGIVKLPWMEDILYVEWN
jgi:hypothetical protein